MSSVVTWNRGASLEYRGGEGRLKGTRQAYGWKEYFRSFSGNDWSTLTQIHRFVPFLRRDTGNWIQGLSHARELLYQMSYIHNPDLHFQDAWSLCQWDGSAAKSNHLPLNLVNSVPSLGSRWRRLSPDLWPLIAQYMCAHIHRNFKNTTKSLVHEFKAYNLYPKKVNTYE